MDKITSLQNTDILAIHEAFQRAFENYFVPMEMSCEQFRERMSSEKVDFSLSFGYFVEGHLTGFMLHALQEEEGKKKVYNAGTGVIPEVRGKGVTQLLYNAAIQKFKEQGVQEIQLEVITKNEPAIKVYKKTGFKISRELIFLKQEPGGKRKIPAAGKGYELRAIENPDLTLIRSFRDWEPSWQNSDLVVMSAGSKVIKTGAYIEDKLAGYIMFNPESGKIHQLAVCREYRRKGIGSSLLHYAMDIAAVPLIVLNMDACDNGYLLLLKAFGFRELLRQFEMHKQL